MLRAVLLGVLTLTAASCKSHDAATSASQTVAAGKVIEVVGTVTLHHGTDTRPLAKGDLIDADDVVETGADGSAVIENQNNNVNWEIGPNKKSKLRESLAWTAPKKDKNAKASEQDSTAAGRHAERSAAESSVTATAPAETEEREDRGETKEAAAVAAPPAAPGGSAPPAPTTTPAPAAPAVQPPPPPPPPPPKVAATAKSAPPPPPSRSASLLPDQGDSFGAGGLGLSGTGEGGGGRGEGIGLGQIGTLGKGGGGGTGQGYGNGGGHIGSATSPNAVASKLVHTKDGDLKGCFRAGTVEHVRITIDSEGKTKLFFTEKVTAEQETCVKTIIDKLEFAKTLAMVALVIKA
jgi:hypothetical protein